MTSLRLKTIRLAQEKPELREVLLPLLKKAAPLSPAMEVYLKGIFEKGGKSMIPAKTFKALAARGLVEGGEAVSVFEAARYGFVSVSLTPKGREMAIEFFRAEHEQRLRDGLKSERIPELLRRRGVEI
jgi:hypothetical protein